MRRPAAILAIAVAALLSSRPAVAQFSQQGPRLLGNGAVLKPGRGYSVALSADGNTAIIGGEADDSYTGAAWVFTRSGTTWTQQGSKLVPSDAAGALHFGSAVAI